MLTELKLTNFRIFDNEITIRFRPITVFIGRNSSGKSSGIKFLLMLKQSLTSSGSQFLTAEGEQVNLGAFPQLKNSLTTKEKLEFSFAINDKPYHGIPSIFRVLDFPEDYNTNALSFNAQGSVCYDEEFSDPVASFSLSDGTPKQMKLEIRDDSSNRSGFWNFQPLPVLRVHTDSNVNKNEPDPPLAEAIESLDNVYEILASIELKSALRSDFDSMQHLPPVRDEAQRFISVSQPPYSSVGPRGQYTLRHLQVLANEQGDRYEFILPHLIKVAGIEDVRFPATPAFISQALAKNAITGARVLIADYGFGVSQCLPIFVQGAIMPKYSTFIIEQPEAQLHPSAQLEIASYFAHLWKERKVSSIIETHSDNILLRLRRLVANGFLSPKDVSVAYFTIDETEKTPTVHNLDINDDGSMEDGLPMEFFGENIIDSLHLGARL